MSQAQFFIFAYTTKCSFLFVVLLSPRLGHTHKRLSSSLCCNLLILFCLHPPPPSAVSSDVCRDLVGSLRNSHLNTAVTFARVCVCVLFSSCVFSFLSPFPLTTTRAEIHEKKNQPKGPILFFFPHPRNSFTSLFLTTCLVVCVCVVLLFLPLSS